MHAGERVQITSARYWVVQISVILVHVPAAILWRWCRPAREKVDLPYPACSLVMKRARLAQELSIHGARKTSLALESGQPSEMAWALDTLLLASCPAEGATPDRLEPSASLPRNPGLIRVLLPIALPTCSPPASPLCPLPPADVHAHRLHELQRKQAWMLLRNMSFMGENEAMLAQSQPLRRLLIYTLRSAFFEHDGDPPLTEAGLFRHPDELAGINEEPAFVEMRTQCSLNPYCVRGFRHGGRGGPCKVVHPSVHLSIIAAQPESSAAAQAAAQANASKAVSLAGRRRFNIPTGVSAGSTPLLLSSSFDPGIHGAAAEVLANLCRQVPCA